LRFAPTWKSAFGLSLHPRKKVRWLVEAGSVAFGGKRKSTLAEHVELQSRIALPAGTVWPSAIICSSMKSPCAALASLYTSLIRI